MSARTLPAPWPRPWVLREQGDANQFCILTPDLKRWIIGLLHNGEPLSDQVEANLRFLVDAANTYDALAWHLRILARDLRVHLEIQAHGLPLEQACPCYPELLAAEALLKRLPYAPLPPLPTERPSGACE